MFSYRFASGKPPHPRPLSRKGRGEPAAYPLPLRERLASEAGRVRGEPNTPRLGAWLAMTAAATFGLAILSAPAFAEEPPLELTWAKLMPPAPPVQNLKAKSFLAGATPWQGAGTSEPPPPPAPTPDDKRWLSEKRLQPGAGAAAAIVPGLDGKRVHIGGYVVPLDFEAAKVKEFLLVPFVGACIHVPPPPPNQIVYVKSAKGFDVRGSFDPVYVTGTLKVASQYTGLAETGYSIDAEKVETRKE
jgi:uncharacterized protein